MVRREHMARKYFAGLMVLVGITLVPATGWAQSSFAGIVTDATGAVLPGVTVEVSSPALIEGVRSAVTDGRGQYRIVDVRPGTYSVVFTLPGFTTFQSEGIELPVNFTASVNAELRVGGLEEVITVTGESPVVDVQRTAPRASVPIEVLKTLPTNWGIAAYVAVTPGLAAGNGIQDVGGTNGEQRSPGGTIHNSRRRDNRLLLDGMAFNGAEGSGRGLYPNPAAIQEMDIALALNSAESYMGAVRFNTIPKEGGNTFSGTFFTNYANEKLSSSNLSSELVARGLTKSGGIKWIGDIWGNFGGPIKEDKLWFFLAARGLSSRTKIPGLFQNPDPTALLYAPTATPELYKEDHQYLDARLTWQASPNNKFSVSNTWQHHCICNFLLYLGRYSPEATTWLDYAPNDLIQATWKQTTTNQLFLEAGASMLYWYDYFSQRQTGVTNDIISITELSQNIRYRSAPQSGVTYGTRNAPMSNYHFSASVVTGAHALKVGVSYNHVPVRKHGKSINGEMDWSFRNGVPSSITLVAGPLLLKESMWNAGIFIQDQWTVGRMTLSPGMRFDYLNASVPAQSQPAGPFVAARSHPEVNCVPCWTDLTPRMGIAYDVFGDGKTAVKAAVGRYLTAEVVGIARRNNPIARSIISAERTWSDANGNFVPDCVLTDFTTNGECGAISNSLFGQNNPRANSYASDILTGNGVRPSSWQTSFSIQQELWSGTAITVGYFRTWYDNFQVTQNTLTKPADYSPYSITAPTDSRLPEGGGFLATGLYDVNPNKFGLYEGLVTQASNFGNITEVFNGIDVTFDMRFGGGAFVSGGVTTGQTVTDKCVAVNDPSVLRYCKTTLPWRGQTQVKLNGTYTLPGDVQASAIYQNLAGIPWSASYVASNAVIAPSLGRDLASGAAGRATVQLIEPNTQFEDRINQLDIRVGKIFRVGDMTFKGMVDIFNVLNNATVLQVNNRFGSAWRRPVRVLDARFVKFGIQMDF